MAAHSAQAIEAELLAVTIGQDEAVRSLAVAAAQHYARMAYQGDVPLKKANVMLVGPTGVGKTMICRALARILDVPFSQVSAPAITTPGVTGLDPDYTLKQLLRRAGKGNKRQAERGIAYLDEVDKIARKDSDEGEKARNLTTGLGVQQAFLDVLDAGVWAFEDGETMDASQVLFICSGAFVGIERFVAIRTHAGLRAARPHPLSQAEALRALEPVDLVSYGMIPEFVGRCPVLIALRPLESHELVRILVEPRDSLLRRITAEFEAIGAELRISEQWLYAIANEANEKRQGARALEGVLRTHLRDAFHAAGSGTLVTIDAVGGWTVQQTVPAAPHSESFDPAKLAERTADPAV